MYPQQKFDKPGKSPFMDMQLVPRYAEGQGAQGDGAAVRIDPSLTQNLGLRLTSVTRGVLASSVDAVGVLAFNEREVAVVQLRTAGFVERVYARAPGICSRPMRPWRISWCRSGRPPRRNSSPSRPVAMPLCWPLHGSDCALAGCRRP